MTVMTGLLDDLLGGADMLSTLSARAAEGAGPLDCHGCGQATPDVEMWATDWETGEEVWLCEACGEA